MADLRDKVLFITGASRGIGKAIALRAARDGAKIVIAAKTAEPHPKLEGTIYTAAQEIEAAGGQALPIVCDIRHEDAVEGAIAKAVETFGGIDILVNNASAISLTPTPATPMKRFDLMHQVNARGTYLCTAKALPHLLKADNAHVLTLCPPLSSSPKWYRSHVGYTMAKMGMSMVVIGHAGEFAGKIGVNGLWPKTAIATAAVKNLIGGDAMMERSRKPEIMADAAHAILTRDGKSVTGNFFVDEDVLREEGVTDFDPYAVDPSKELVPDFFLD
ncbi:MAG: NAD(P)-dependent oxidoreductase [Myxococcota bacterium]